MLAVPLGGLVEVELAEVVGQHSLVLLLEDARVLAERVLPAVVSVLGDLVDEEERQRLDALREQFTLFIEVSADDLAYLDAPLLVLGHVLGDLARTDDVAVAQLDDIAIGIDVPDEQALVRLDAAGDVVQVHALAQPLHLTLDAQGGLHLQLDACLRAVRALADLQPVHIQVGGVPARCLTAMPRTAIFLTSFWL